MSGFKYFMFGVLVLFLFLHKPTSSSSLFIPIVIPPLLSFSLLKIDRRAVACVITGLIKLICCYLLDLVKFY